MDFRSYLKQLAAVEEDGPSVLTLALDLSKAGIPKIAQVFLKDEVYPRLEAGGLKGTAKRLRIYLEGLAPAVDGLFLVAGRTVWEPLELAQPLRNFVHVDRRPYLAPLFEMAVRGGRSAVVMINGREAILREVQAGRSAEVGRVARERPESDPEKAYNNVRNMRGRVNARQGVVGGAERDLHDKAVDETFRNMIRETARRVAERHQAEPLQRVYFTGSAEHVEFFRQRLPSSLRDAFVYLGHEAGDPGRVPDETARAYDEETARLAGEFRSFRKEGVRTALGPQEVLDRLVSGDVERVFLNPDDPLPGRVCGGCRARFVERVGACPYCEGELEERSLVQEVLGHALQHPPIDVRFVRDAWLAEAGGMAAVTRVRGGRRKTG